MKRTIPWALLLTLLFGMTGSARAEFLFDVYATAYDIGSNLNIDSYYPLDGAAPTSPASVTHNSITYNFDSGRIERVFTIPAGVSGSVGTFFFAYEKNFSPGPGGEGWDSFATLENIRFDWVFPSVNNAGPVDSTSQNLSAFTATYLTFPTVAFPVGVHHGFLAVSHSDAFNSPLYRNLASPNGTSNGIAGADYTMTTNFPLTIEVLDAAPVPEPATLLIWAGFGLVVGGARLYRRRRPAS